jgi:hypothetical protein
MVCGFDRPWRDIDWLDLRCASLLSAFWDSCSVVDCFGLEQDEPEI